MIARANMSFDKNYYAQYFSDWMRTRSKYRKFAPTVALLIIATGIIVLTKAEHLIVVGSGIIVVGVFHLIDSLTYRSRWIKRRLQSGGSASGHIEFYEDRIHIRSDSSEGHFLLSGFIDATPSYNGIFLIPQKGVSFYIPWSSIEPSELLPEIRALLSKRQNKPAHPTAGNVSI